MAPPDWFARLFKKLLPVTDKATPGAAAQTGKSRLRAPPEDKDWQEEKVLPSTCRLLLKAEMLPRLKANPPEMPPLQLRTMMFCRLKATAPAKLLGPAPGKA